MAKESRLSRELGRALRGDAELGGVIDEVSDEPVATAAEAELVVQVLRKLPLAAPSSDSVVSSPVHDVVAWFQGVESEAAFGVLDRFGGPELVRLFDRLFVHVESCQDDLMFLLKVLALYVPDGGLERLVTAARSPLLADAYLWSVVFEISARPDHPWGPELARALSDPLPSGFLGVAFLDLSNTLAREARIERHPWDSDRGVAELSRFTSSRVEEEFSYARSALGAAPFLSPPAAERLLALGREHPDMHVRIEAAWASAHTGREQGFAELQQACADPRYAAVAMHYLEELDASHRIPLVSRTEDFRAMAEMCQWLAHPSEFGRVPDRIEQVDSRELHWPPTNDVRRVWLFRYRYPGDEGAEPDEGLGMVGSVTFALFGETTADKTPEDAYALHCAWELEMNQDPRAPEKRTVAAGRRILAEYNEGF